MEGLMFGSGYVGISVALKVKLYSLILLFILIQYSFLHRGQK